MKTQKKLACEMQTANKTKTSTKQNTTKILSPIKSGYVQHTSPLLNSARAFRNLGGKLKEYIYPKHSREGKFYISYYWKKCPICYEPKEAIMKK